jgi:hypothetical protein
MFKSPPSLAAFFHMAIFLVTVWGSTKNISMTKLQTIEALSLNPKKHNQNSINAFPTCHIEPALDGSHQSFATNIGKSDEPGYLPAYG